MLQLEPRKIFPIVRQLGGPLDTTTYYVRAYIRDSFDNTLLETVDLVDKTGQRFTYNYRTIADKSGEGTFIDISTKVFTDSGYTSESDVYIREVTTYQVKEQWNRIHNPGGGDPLAVPHEPDYSGFGKIVDKRIKDIKFPEQQKIDLQPVIDAINNIHIPQPIIPEKFPIGAITRLIEQVRMKVEGLPKPIKPKEVDFSGVYKEIANSLEKIRAMFESVNGIRTKEAKETKKEFGVLLKKLKKKKIEAQEEPKEEPKKTGNAYLDRTLSKLKTNPLKPWRKNY